MHVGIPVVRLEEYKGGQVSFCGLEELGELGARKERQCLSTTHVRELETIRSTPKGRPGGRGGEGGRVALPTPVVLDLWLAWLSVWDSVAFDPLRLTCRNLQAKFHYK